MDLSTATRQLYDADPAAFVSLRTSLVKQAKADGDRDLAARVQELRRPTVAAWYVNLLVRTGDPALSALLDLGVTMRAHQAQFNVAAITELTPQRRALETQVIHHLEELLAARGTSASAASLDEVRGTINAAISDERADAVVRTGTLVRSLSYAGFGVDLEGAAMTVPPPRLRLVREGETPQVRETPPPTTSPPEDPGSPDQGSPAPHTTEPDPQTATGEPKASPPEPEAPAASTTSARTPQEPPQASRTRRSVRDRDHQQREALAQRRVNAAARAVEQAEQRLQSAIAARDEAVETLRDAQQRLAELTDRD